MLPQFAIWCLESDWMRSAICVGRFWFWVWFLWQVIASPSNSEGLTIFPFISLAFSLWSNVMNVHTQWGCNVKALTFKTLGYYYYFAWDMELQRWLWCYNIVLTGGWPGCITCISIHKWQCISNIVWFLLKEDWCYAEGCNWSPRILGRRSQYYFYG